MKTLDTPLKDRVLRFDGVSVVSPEMITELMLLGAQPHEIRVNGDSWEVQQYNANVAEEAELRPPGDPVKIDLSWQLPEKYQELDLWERVMDAYAERADDLDYTVQEEEHMGVRIEMEYAEIKKRGMMQFMRTICYVLDTFREKGVVWGVGRGSSCACYILFILGLHSVDCVRLEVPMEEFFHD